LEVEKIQVKEIMRKRVITVKESTTLRELIEIFDKYTFHTLPVVDKENKVVGIVAFEDILKVFEPHPSYIMDMLRRTPLWEEYGIKDFLEIDIPPEIGILCVAEDLMNTNVITTTESGNSSINSSSIIKFCFYIYPVGFYYLDNIFHNSISEIFVEKPNISESYKI